MRLLSLLVDLISIIPRCLLRRLVVVIVLIVVVVVVFDVVVVVAVIIAVVAVVVVVVIIILVRIKSSASHFQLKTSVRNKHLRRNGWRNRSHDDGKQQID